MIHDPWKSLAKPAAEPTISALRVDPQHPWDFFWAKDAEGHCLLVLRHTPDTGKGARLPRLRGLDVIRIPSTNGGQDVLLLRLLEGEFRDIFLTLCTDIIRSTEQATTEQEALDTTIRRTWRWHHLLRGGADGRLSPEEQKGLIGELLFLDGYLLPRMDALDAVRAWTGPEGAPKDFQVGELCIEAKARRGSATPEVAISSEHQLDTSGIQSLFLHVVNLASSPVDGGGLSVADIADQVRARLRLRDPLAAEAFEERLEAAGLEAVHDYTDSLWLQGESWIYEVTDEFPHLAASGLPSGVSRVRYSISLTECEAYRRDPSILIAGIEGAIRHGE